MQNCTKFTLPVAYVNIILSMLSILYERSASRLRTLMDHNDNLIFNCSNNINAIKSTILFDQDMGKFETVFDRLVEDDMSGIFEDEDPLLKELTGRLQLIKKMQTSLPEEDLSGLLLASSFIVGFCPGNNLEDIIFQYTSSSEEDTSSEEEEDEEIQEETSEEKKCTCDVCNSFTQSQGMWNMWFPQSVLGKNIKKFVDNSDKLNVGDCENI